jgi:hypothetical protein
MRKLITTAGLLALVGTCSAYDTQVTGHVKAVSINETFGSYVFVQLDTAHAAPQPCQTNVGWTYTIPQNTDAEKKILALLMMAKATGLAVTLYGRGSCSDFGAIESSHGIEIDP